MNASKVMGIIFTNDASIGDLTNKRSMAAIPFGGRYRQVDFALSNLSCAGVHHIAIVSRFNYQSLMDHIGDGEEWGLELGEGGLQYITPYAHSESHTYRGKLESLDAAMDFMQYGADDEYVVMMDSAIIYNIDVNKMLAAHKASGSDITVAFKAGIANGSKILDLAVKMDGGKIKDMVVDYPAPADYLTSIDCIICSKKWLVATVKERIAHNRYHMDRDLILGSWVNNAASVNPYIFESTALYNDSVKEYYDNSMALLKKGAFNDIFFASHPVYTKVRDRVPTYYGEGSAVNDCLVADGCKLNGKVTGSILFRNVVIAKNASVDKCVLFADANIGEGCELQYVILDKNVTVTPGTRLIGTATSPIVIKRGETV